MALTLETAGAAISAALAGGLAQIDPMLQALYESPAPDGALITALTDLRGRLLLEQMSLNRAHVTAMDNDPSTETLLSRLDGACATLDGLQRNSEASSAWASSLATALDEAMTVYAGLARAAG